MVRVIVSGGLAGGFVSAAPAYAGVTAPRPVSPREVAVQPSAVTTGGARTAVLMAGYVRSAHPQRFSLKARLGGAARLGPRLRLASHQAFFPQLAVGVRWHRRRGADGEYGACHGGAARRYRASAPQLRSVQTLSRARSMLGGVGVTATGRAVVARHPSPTARSGTSVQVAIAAPGRRFGARQTLGKSRFYELAVTVAPNGTVLVAWLDAPSPPPPPAPPQPATPARVTAATLAQDASRFGPATELTTLNAGPAAQSPRADRAAPP